MTFVLARAAIAAQLPRGGQRRLYGARQPSAPSCNRRRVWSLSAPYTLPAPPYAAPRDGGIEKGTSDAFQETRNVDRRLRHCGGVDVRRDGGTGEWDPDRPCRKVDLRQTG